MFDQPVPKSQIIHDLSLEAAKLSFLRDTQNQCVKPTEIVRELHNKYVAARSLFAKAHELLENEDHDST